MPEEISHEKVQQFVLAQAAIGITAVGVTKGIFSKAFLTFHLNTIIMTTTISASLISVLVWTSNSDKVSAQTNSSPKPKFEYSAAAIAPEIITEKDTPIVTSTKAIANGENVSVTTVTTETGTNIKIVTSSNNQTSVYYNTPSDSNYVFAYASENDNASAAIAGEGFAYHDIPELSELPDLPPMSELPELEWLDRELADLSRCVYTCSNDTLMNVIQKSLVKDGLISDSLHYTFKINGSYMKVNGEKVDKDIWKKYKEIIENKSPNRVNRSFSYAISRDGEDTSLNLENYVN